MTNDDTGSFNAGWWHCAHQIPLGQRCDPCAATTGGQQMTYRDQARYRENLLAMEQEGRDLPPDLSWSEVRALIEQLEHAGFDVEPHTPAGDHRAYVSVRGDNEAAMYAVGSYGGTVTALPGGGGVSRVTWEEAGWPMSGHDLREYVGNSTIQGGTQ